MEKAVNRFYTSMEIKELTGEQIRRIYKERMPEDFSPDEIKPLSRIEEALSTGHYACYGAFEGVQILAYAFFVINNRYALLDYFAVRDDMRGKGIGSKFIQKMTKGLMHRFENVLLESEDPDYADSEAERSVMERRIRFYLENGLVKTGVRSTVWNVYYRVLSFPVGSIPSADQTREIYRGLYRVMLPEELYNTKVLVS